MDIKENYEKILQEKNKYIQELNDSLKNLNEKVNMEGKNKNVQEAEFIVTKQRLEREVNELKNQLKEYDLKNNRLLTN